MYNANDYLHKEVDELTSAWRSNVIYLTNLTKLLHRIP